MAEHKAAWSAHEAAEAAPTLLSRGQARRHKVAQAAEPRKVRDETMRHKHEREPALKLAAMRVVH